MHLQIYLMFFEILCQFFFFFFVFLKEKFENFCQGLFLWYTKKQERTAIMEWSMLRVEIVPPL